MKNLLISLVALVGVVEMAKAQSIGFYSGSFVASNQVSMVVLGPASTNVTCYLERRGLTNQTWSVVATYTITNGGPAYVTGTLDQGKYGYFRTRSTNNAYYSTNAFGAIAGQLGNGLSLLGNPFGATSLTNIFPNPVNGDYVDQWADGGTNYVESDFVGNWTSNLTIGPLQGFFAYNGDTNALAYHFCGVVNTNYAVKSIAQGYSIITSPRYALLNTSTLQNDLLSTNQLGGYLGIPVQSPGYTNPCVVEKWIAAGNYFSYYYLTNQGPSNIVWTPSAAPLGLGEGFFIYKPTNATWTVNMPVW
jgi:hypothetical protein